MNIQGLADFIRKNLVMAFSAIVMVGSMTLYLVHKDKNSLLDSEIEQVNIRISSMMKNIKNSKGLEADIESIEGKVEELNNRMFQAQELATNYNYFFNLEDETGIKVSDIKQIGIAEETTDPKMKRMPKPVVNSYEKIRFHLKASGEYAEIVNFLRKLEGGPSFYRLEKLRLAKSEAREPELLYLDIAFLMLGEKVS
jgi:Tfp pilus assembly protein PilO